MHIQFNLHNFAFNNSKEACYRECTRAACLAWGLRQLGIKATLLNAPNWLHSSELWQPFREMCTMKPGGQITIARAETKPRPKTIGFKTSIGTNWDKQWLEQQLLIGIEHEVADQDNPRLFRTPWGISFDMWQFFQRQGLLDAYLSNDLETIRAKLRVPQTCDKICFMGCQMYGRRVFGNALCDRYPDLFEIFWTDGQSLPVDQYVPWVMGFEGGLDLPGFDFTDGAKTYRFTETLVLGRVLVYVPGRIAEDPPVTDDMAIIVDSPDVDLRAKWANREQLRVAADQTYKDCWSPLGQARRLLAFMREHGYV